MLSFFIPKHLLCVLLVLSCCISLAWANDVAQVPAEKQVVTEPAEVATMLPPADLRPSIVIDMLIEQGWHDREMEPSPPCEDRAFVRRVYLDLIGRIPTPAEAAEFLAITEPKKRTVLVDRLLESPEFARHFSEVFDASLMGRTSLRKHRERDSSQWFAFLETAFRENRPWNEVAETVLLARPKTAAERGAVWYLYERKDNYQKIAEAISPGFFGMQIDCAQCHDHPLAGEIEQDHYWGLVAFFNRGKNVTTKRGFRIRESAAGGFSKFTNALTGDTMEARLTFLGSNQVVADPARTPVIDEESENPDAEIPDVVATDGTKTAAEEKNELDEEASDQYLTVDENGRPLDPPVPVFSRRQQFVEKFVRGNPLIARAAVNRIWALLMGRGISHPVDRMNSNHDPSHPELLDWLARDFECHRYNIKRLVKNIVLSRPYGLKSQPLGKGIDDAAFAWSLPKPLTAEALYRSMLIVTDGSLTHEQDVALNAFQKQFGEVTPEETVATLRQTLFLSNNKIVQAIIQDRPDSNLLRLAQKNDDETVNDAFQLAYGRAPDENEQQACSFYLAERADRRAAAIEQMMWALLNSAEFRFNH